VFGPVLSFLSRSLKQGFKLDPIVKTAINFFKHDAVLQAKKILHSELDIQTLSYAKNDDNITDMCKSLVTAVKQNILILKFVIFSP